MHDNFGKIQIDELLEKMEGMLKLAGDRDISQRLKDSIDSNVNVFRRAIIDRTYRDKMSRRVFVEQIDNYPLTKAFIGLNEFRTEVLIRGRKMNLNHPKLNELLNEWYLVQTGFGLGIRFRPDIEENKRIEKELFGEGGKGFKLEDYGVWIEKSNNRTYQPLRTATPVKVTLHKEDIVLKTPPSLQRDESTLLKEWARAKQNLEKIEKEMLELREVIELKEQKEQYSGILKELKINSCL